MKKTILFVLFIFFLFDAICQTESLHLHLDKTVCYPGDTVWYRAYVFNNTRPGSLSTNLYVELYNDTGKLIARHVTPIVSGMSIGQMPTPKRPGFYWLRGYTEYGYPNAVFRRAITVANSTNFIVTRSLFDINNVDYSDTLGVVITTSFTQRGLSCYISPAPGSDDTDRDIKIVLSQYGNQIADHVFTLKKKHEKNVLIPMTGIFGFVTATYYLHDKPVITHNIYIPEANVPNIELTKNTVGSWNVKVQDTINWNFSVSVTNADIPSPSRSITQDFVAPYISKNKPDTEYLCVDGTAHFDSKKQKPITNKEFAIILEKDSIFKTSTMMTDSLGRFHLSQLFFFDTAFLNFQINGEASFQTDVDIKLTPKEFPKFNVPDTMQYEEDTTGNTLPIVYSNLLQYDSLKYLKPVTVLGRRNLRMDKFYTTGLFSMITPYSYDMREDYGIKKGYYYDIWSYLSAKVAGFQHYPNDTNSPKVNGKSAIIYVDERLINWKFVDMYYLNEFAYVKVFTDFWVDDTPFLRMVSEVDGQANRFQLIGDGPLRVPKDDGLHTVISIYTRKGTDTRTGWKGLSKIAIAGYTPVKQFLQPDRMTLVWKNYVDTNNFDLKFENPYNAKNLRFVIEGVNQFGEVLHFEKTVSE